MVAEEPNVTVLVSGKFRFPEASTIQALFEGFVLLILMWLLVQRVVKYQQLNRVRLTSRHHILRDKRWSVLCKTYHLRRLSIVQGNFPCCISDLEFIGSLCPSLSRCPSTTIPFCEPGPLRLPLPQRCVFGHAA